MPHGKPQSFLGIQQSTQKGIYHSSLRLCSLPNAPREIQPPKVSRTPSNVPAVVFLSHLSTCKAKKAIAGTRCLQLTMAIKIIITSEFFFKKTQIWVASFSELCGGKIQTQQINCKGKLLSEKCVY